jgi:hypothetical protein
MPRFNKGFVKFYQDEWDSVLSSNQSLWFVWSWLKLNATRFETTIQVNYQPVTLPMGSVVFGLQEIADAGKMGIATVHRWIGFLEKAEYISVIRSKRGTVVTIRNFEQFVTDMRQVENNGKTTEKQLKNHWKLNRDKKEEEDKREEENTFVDFAEAQSTPTELSQTTELSNSPTPDSAPLASLPEAGAEGNPPKVPPAPPASVAAEPALHPLARLWNEHSSPLLPRVRATTGSRLHAAQKLWKKNPSEQFWLEVIAKINASDFCLGKKEGAGNWRANFDWLVRPQTAIRVSEGLYDNAKNGSNLILFDDFQTRAKAVQL